jgi:hypothetical protein
MELMARHMKQFYGTWYVRRGILSSGKEENKEKKLFPRLTNKGIISNYTFKH